MYSSYWCVHLIKTIDTADNRHDALNIPIDGIRVCFEFGCLVTSLVTNNAANMSRMRQDLAQAKTDVPVDDVITHGCSSYYILHL